MVYASTSITHLNFLAYDVSFNIKTKGGNAMEQELRKKAISRYLQGDAPKAIYTDLQRSKYWFFKWLKRYQSGKPDWFRDKSRSALHRPTQIGEAERQRIVSVRTRLESERFAQIGASAIKWELSKSGHDFPSDRTINRVLKDEGLIKKNSVRPQGRRVPVLHRSA
jgi:hypothetical protein